MPDQPSFTTPAEMIVYLRGCLEQEDPTRFYAAFREPVSDFWRPHIFQSLKEIDQADTLERIFLEDGKLSTFPTDETTLHLGGHGPRTQYIHITLIKQAGMWQLDSIHVCR